MTGIPAGAGGTMSGAVRVGDRVHRVAGPWTPTVHKLLDHLRARGVPGLPRPLGFDRDGREVLTHLPGTVPRDPLPGWVWTDAVLAAAARRLAVIHAATRDFEAPEAAWRGPDQPTREPTGSAGSGAAPPPPISAAGPSFGARRPARPSRRSSRLASQPRIRLITM